MQAPFADRNGRCAPPSARTGCDASVSSDVSDSRPGSAVDCAAAAAAPAWTARVWRTLRTRSVWAAATLLMLGTSVTPATDRPVLQVDAADPDRLVFPIDGRVLTAPVDEAPLALELDLRGELEAIDNEIVTSQCYRSVPLIELVDEGTWVEKGDVVARLDSSEIDERIQREQVDVIEAQAKLDSAIEKHKMQKLTNASKQAKAELVVELAQIDLETYREAEFPQKLHEGQNKLSLAEEALVRQQKNFEFVSRMVGKGYKSASEVDAARAELNQAKHDYETAAGTLDVLTRHTRGREMTDLAAKARIARDELERVISTNNTNLVARAIDIETARKRLRSQQEYLAKLETAKEACTMYAPRAGRVVHARESSWGGAEPIEEGDTIYERQAVVQIPRFDRMRVSIRVHESQVRHMQPGLPVSVALDSQPDRSYPGTIESVSSVPTSGRWPNYDLKEYPAVVVLEGSFGDESELRPGLTARATVHVDERSRCSQVPVQSVVPIERDDRTQMTVFVRRGDAIEVRPVEVGLSTEAMIEVVGGLQPGEEVVLSPRTELSDELTTLYRRS